MDIGFMGLGRMGENMVRRLLRGGQRVVAWNRSKPKIDEVVQEGAVAAYTVQDLVKNLKPRRVIWLMVPAGQPVITLPLDDEYDLGAEFFRWEMAIAVAGKLLGINPFDEPNVTESKNNTKRLLDEYARSHRLPEEEPTAAEGAVELFAYPGGTSGDGSQGSSFQHGQLARQSAQPGAGHNGAGGESSALAGHLAALFKQVQQHDYLALHHFQIKTVKYQSVVNLK